MKKSFFTLWILGLLATENTTNGQVYSNIFRNEVYDTIPKTILKFNPFMFFARYSHISVAGEFRITPYSSFQIEAGYITRIFTENTLLFYDENETPYHGFRVNPEWRFYSPEKGYMKFYLGPEVYFQQIYRNQSIEYGFDFNGSWYEWIQSYDVKHTQMLYGFNLIAGFQGAPKGFPFFDVFAGIGARFQNNFYGNTPDPTNATPLNGEQESYSSSPFITIGVKVGLVMDKHE